MRGMLKLLPIMVLILIFSVMGCATSVTMRYMVPAKINMVDYRSLAVFSVEPYRFPFFDNPPSVIPDMSGTSPSTVFSGFAGGTERRIAKYLTDRIEDDLRDTDYFTLLTPPRSDAVGIGYSELRMMGYDALLRVRVTDLDVEEYIFAKEETVVVPPDVEGGQPTTETVLRHHVMQKVGMDVVFSLIDTATGKIIASEQFSDHYEQSYKLDKDLPPTVASPPLYDKLVPMAREFSKRFSQLVAPRWESRSVSLMKNKPENRRVEQAYLMAKEGNLRLAFEEFEDEWDRSSHVPSGYNAAIILESLGEMEEAIQLMEDVWRTSGNRTVGNRLERMRRSYALHMEAQGQL